MQLRTVLPEMRIPPALAETISGSQMPSQKTFRYGRRADVPVAGSWTGRPRSGIGVERDGRWLLRNSRRAGKPALRPVFGRPSDRAVVGDWDGDGVTTVGVVRGTRFHLRATNSRRSAATSVRFVG